jgi:uncharacterized damage-inducible protein DinB
MTENRPEVWLRGPVEGVPPLLQPVAHALLQAVEECEHALRDFPADLLWDRPGGVASVGFHLQHLRGVIDRLFTYARGEPLSPRQREELAAEGRPLATDAATLLDEVRQQVDRAIAQLRATDEASLTDARGVGAKQLPSTVLGLCFHAAEHTQRHVGQLLVTVRVQLADGRASS